MMSSYFFMRARKELESGDRGWGRLFFASCLLCAFHIHQRPSMVVGVHVWACLPCWGVTWADPPREQNSIDVSGPTVDFPCTKTHLSNSSTHDGGQMSAPVCRLLRMPMWHVNMSSRIKCCRWIFHFLQCLHVFLCVYIGGEDQIIFYEEKEHRSIIVLYNKCSKYNDKQMSQKRWN